MKNFYFCLLIIMGRIRIIAQPMWSTHFILNCHILCWILSGALNVLILQRVFTVFFSYISEDTFYCIDKMLQYLTFGEVSGRMSSLYFREWTVDISQYFLKYLRKTIKKFSKVINRQYSNIHFCYCIFQCFISCITIKAKKQNNKDLT